MSLEVATTLFRKLPHEISSEVRKAREEKGGNDMFKTPLFSYSPI